MISVLNFFGFADVARREMALLHAISIFCEVYDDEVPAEQLLKDLQQVEYRALLYLGFDLIYTLLYQRVMVVKKVTDNF